MNILKTVRQGDMILFKVADVEGSHNKNTNRVVVGLGEVTGHSHDVTPLNDGTSTLKVYADKAVDTVTEDDLAMMDKLFFEVTGNAVITHEEHDPIVLDEGKYLRINQVEVDPFTKELQKVKD